MPVCVDLEALSVAGAQPAPSAVELLGAPPYQSSPTELSQTFWITLPGMIKRLTRLEHMGLLQRGPHPEDGRSVTLRLTDKGLSTLRDLLANHQPPEYDALLELPAAQREALARILASLLDRIDARHGQRRPPYIIR